MKPILLEMSAFGPFATQTRIDFEALSGELFLLTGETGAGKTSIFDAISFALYGEASGGKERRSGKSFRSDFATAEAKTFVRFVFVQGGKRFEITRALEFERPKLRGSGTTVSPATVTLIEEGSPRVLTRMEEVDARICEIVGLDRQQFSRTVMIAQGDFLRILNASSAERRQMFGHLFHTELYARAEEGLKERVAACQSTRTTLAERAKMAAAAAQMPENDARYDTFLRLREGAAANPAEFLALLKLYTNELDEVISHKTKAADTLREALSRADLAHSEAQRLNSKIEELLALRVAPELSLDAAAARERERAALALATRALRVLSPYKVLENAKRLDTEAQKKAEAAFAALCAAEKVNAAAAEALQEATRRAEELAALDAAVTRLDGAMAAVDDYEKAMTRLAMAEGELTVSVEAAKEAERRVSDLQAKYILGQAGLLARELTDGEPCPVCGALQHPSPAVLPESTPDKKSVDAAIRARTQAEQARAVAIGEHTVAAEALQKARDALTAQGVLSLTRDVKDLLLAERTAKQEAAALIRESLQESREAAERAQNDLASARAAEGVTRAAANAAGADVQRAEDEFAALLSAAEFASIEAWRDALVDEPSLVARTEALKKSDDAAARAAGHLAELDRTVAGREAVDLDGLREKREALADEEKRIREELTSLQNTRTLDLRAAEELTQIVSRVERLNAEWGVLDTLCRTVSGRAQNGREKLSLEGYVQRYYFKEVVVAANRRLQVLTDGNFVLRCREGAADLRRVAGLDLEVLDKTTGRWRDVSTLSGGESFMASLALAVGLSDVVQNSSGSVRLDMLFIDEGFGSLDEQALLRAMEMLSRLCDGKRTVGVISHVAQLREHITKRLVVTRTPTGSTVRGEGI